MRNRTPVPREERPPLPDFAPVPRRYRHDGWTPERQKAFIEALAETIAGEMLSSFSRLEGVTVRIDKPGAPIPAILEGISVEITRTRET